MTCSEQDKSRTRHIGPVVESQPVDRPEWTDVHFGENYRVTYRLFDESILIVEPNGSATLQEMKLSLLFQDKILSEIFPGDRAYFFLEDMSKIENISRDARKCFIEYVMIKQHLQGLIFFSVSSLFKLSIVLGKRLNRINFLVEVADNYADALRLAQGLLSKTQTKTDDSHAFTSPGSHDVSNEDSPKQTNFSNPDWCYHAENYTLAYEVVNGNILHGYTTGRLEKQHIDPSFRLKERIIRPIWSSFGSYYYVLGLNGSKGTGQKTRKQYIQAMLALYRKYPFKLFIFYGTSKLLRAGINMVGPFVPFNVQVVEDLDSALSIIAENGANGMASVAPSKFRFFRKRQCKHKQIQPYVNDVLKYLEEIDWVGNMPTAGRRDPSHPFNPVFDAIDLVKWELDDLIAERSRTEERLKLAKDQAEAANNAKSDFLANMSHELRTPLNHIIGFTELVLDKNFGDLNKTQSEYLNDVRDSSFHLLSLINDVLDLSKVESGKLELHTSRVNLVGLLENSFKMIKEKALKHGIEITSHLNGLPEMITADERKLKQIMYNLLSNAVKFTPNGGQISVTARLCERDDTSIPATATIDGGFVEISVSDSGIGLNPDDLNRIFNPFEQVEKSSTKVHQGTGLGLSLTKSMVELHGGSIWAESNGEGNGNGATFSFCIPV